MADEPVATNPNAGVGTVAAPPENVANYQDWVLSARQRGYTQADIDDASLRHIAEQRAAGVADADIQKQMGVNDPTDLHDLFKSRAIASLGTFTAPAAQGVGQEFVTGLEGSSGGLRWRGQLPEMQMPSNAGFWGTQAYNAGTLLGSMADAVTGGTMGAGAGLLTGPGAPVAVPGGAVIGAMALPAMEREQYMQALIKGQTTGWKDFAQREGAVMWEGIKAATIAKFTAGAGGAVEGLGGQGFVAGMQKIAVETAAMTSTSAALEGHVPDWTDLGTGAITIAALHAATAPTRMTPQQVRTVALNLAKNWAQTGEAPAAAAARAASDEGFYQNLVLPKPPEPPPMSSETPTEGGTVFVIGKGTPQTSTPIDSALAEEQEMAEPFLGLNGPKGPWIKGGTSPETVDVEPNHAVVDAP